MANQYGPRIVTDGLVLCLDAANRKSYPGTGTTWTDLSGNGNNGTLVNGVGYSSGNKGSLSFDGSNDYIQGSIQSSIFANPHSISCWLYRTNVVAWSALFSNNVGANSCSILTFINNTNYIGTNNAGVDANAISADLGSDHLNKWIYATIVYTGVTSGSTVNVYAYKDSTLISNSGNLYWNLNSSSNYYIGRHYTDVTYQIHSGLITQVCINNRVLSANEVQQNFEATKGRYGL